MLPETLNGPLRIVRRGKGLRLRLAFYIFGDCHLDQGADHGAFLVGEFLKPRMYVGLQSQADEDIGGTFFCGRARGWLFHEFSVNPTLG
jgi:hypothetical protein